MRRTIFLTAIFIMIPLFMTAGNDERYTDWSLSFTVSESGYATEGILKDTPYGNVSFGWEPFQRKTLDPKLIAGLLFSPLAGDGSSLAAHVGIELETFIWEDHPLRWVIERESHLIPSVSAEILLPGLSFDEMLYCLTASPIRLSFAFGSASILEPQLLLDQDLSVTGWGLRLFCFSNYIQ